MCLALNSRLGLKTSLIVVIPVSRRALNRWGRPRFFTPGKCSIIAVVFSPEGDIRTAEGVSHRSLSHNVSPFGLAARLVIRFRGLTPPAFHVSHSGLVNPVNRKPNCANQIKRKTKFLAVQTSAQRLMFSNRA